MMSKQSERYHIKQKVEVRPGQPTSYNWAIWLENGYKTIDDIERVKYLLHPSFKRNVRVIANRRTRFRLKSSGWGEFMIKINIVEKDGNHVLLRHWLDFSNSSKVIKKEDKEILKLEKSPQSVFISYDGSSIQKATKFMKTLTRKGLNVKSARDADHSRPLKDSIESLIRESDIVMVLKTGDMSEWQKQDEILAERMNKKIISIDDMNLHDFNAFEDDF